MLPTPSVLFVCVHNAGRSQMAQAFLTHLAGDAVEVRFTGSAPRRTRVSLAAGRRELECALMPNIGRQRIDQTGHP
ncbi:hypothetical protein IU475_32605 [Nocardia beijingensis]|nr:hypothetical protein [Nocardia beijingensis]